MLYFNEIHILSHILAFLCDEPLSPFCQNRLISVRTLRNVESTQTKTKVRWNELQFTRPVPNLDEIHSAVPEIKHADIWMQAPYTRSLWEILFLNFIK
jgi:hypothetical protein